MQRVRKVRVPGVAVADQGAGEPAQHPASVDVIGGPATGVQVG